jgi:serine kinase of HPr protein (carbohydrate metabolism regulator)
LKDDHTALHHAAMTERNLAVLIEAAVRNTILQLRGINTLQDFMERQRLAMQKNCSH